MTYGPDPAYRCVLTWTIFFKVLNELLKLTYKRISHKSWMFSHVSNILNFNLFSFIIFYIELIKAIKEKKKRNNIKFYMLDRLW